MEKFNHFTDVLRYTIKEYQKECIGVIKKIAETNKEALFIDNDIDILLLNGHDDVCSVSVEYIIPINDTLYCLCSNDERVYFSNLLLCDQMAIMDYVVEKYNDLCKE